VPYDRNFTGALRNCRFCEWPHLTLPSGQVSPVDDIQCSDHQFLTCICCNLV